MTNKMGWIPDFPDKRDKLYLKIQKPVTVPEFVDLREYCPPVEDQGDLGSCTAQALVGNLEFLLIKNGKPFVDLSRLFVYYNERRIEGMINEDSGAMLRDGIKVLNSDGVCTEKCWPYAKKRFKNKPTPACYEEAKKRRIVSYHRILNLNEMINCLAEGFPFVFGFTVYDSFMSDKVSKTGIAEMPTNKESTLGGHAVMAVGYDKKTERFTVRNSWGEKWGQLGYFTMPFEYLEELAADFWTIRV